MRNPTCSRYFRLALLAGAMGLSFTAMAQSPQSPQPTFRMLTPTQPPATAPAAAPAVSGAELRDIAVDAYVYAYPMVLMEVTRRNATNVQTPLEGRAPMNMFGHKTAFPDARTARTRWPSTDTLYSSMWYDVSREPLIVRVPDAGNRYYFLTLLDMWTDVYASRGTRTVGNRPQAFAIVGPYWQGTVPPGVEVLRSPTATGWVLGNVQASGPADYGAVNQFQSGLVTQPLSTVGPSYGQADRTFMPLAPQAAGVDANASNQAAPADQVAAMDAPTFWGVFAQVVRDNPPHANDYPMLDRLRRIGMGQPIAYGSLDPAVQQALAQAGPQAGRRIADYVAGLGEGYNGWNTVSEGIGTYGTDYLRRAAIAYAGLGTGVPEDVMYPVTSIDSKGRALEGGRDYVLHFDKGQLPPVNAFWSLALYGPNQTFAENQANKYAVHSTDALKYNADGSLDVYIQHKTPSRDKQANWLPAPDAGPYMLNMRLYWPRAIALDGSWAPPPVQRN